jgi:septation ring formation regulator EzrA
MNMQRHFEISSASTLREASVIRTLMDDLNRTICILNCDIATEEERARVFERSDAMYPILARTLAARRDNLKVTVAALDQRLAKIRETIPQAIETAA